MSNCYSHKAPLFLPGYVSKLLRVLTLTQCGHCCRRTEPQGSPQKPPLALSIHCVLRIKGLGCCCYEFWRQGCSCIVTKDPARVTLVVCLSQNSEAALWRHWAFLCGTTSMSLARGSIGSVRFEAATPVFFHTLKMKRAARDGL